MEEKLITVSKGNESLKIHPSTLKAHERAGWVKVEEKAKPALSEAPTEATVEVADEKSKGKPSKTQK